MFDLDGLRFENGLAQWIHDKLGGTGTTYRKDYGTWNTKTFPQSGTLPKRSK